MLRDNTTWVVTDSGLGGLSVVAHLVRMLDGRKLDRDLNIIYFNAWPDVDCTYDGLPSAAEKARVFDGALRGMMRFNPDRILIACNTLSVVYPETEFSRHATVDVVDIVDFGVGMLVAALRAHPGSRAVIFGTPTTIASDAHRTALLKRGIGHSRIVAQTCYGLPGKIERNPRGADVRAAVAEAVRAVGRQVEIASALPLFAALCCTHFEYSQPLFESCLKQTFKRPVVMLNPNLAMSEGCLPPQGAGGSAMRARIDVVSRIPLEQAKITAVGDMLAATSPLVARALAGYRHDKKLFDLP